MTHFPVGVILKDINELESVLEKYNENKEVEEYISKSREAMIEEQKEMAIKRGETLTEEEAIEKARAWNNGEKFDFDGNLLSTYNPDSKYDYYVIGGRYKNWLKKKTGGLCDYAKIKDIDFSLDKEEYDKGIRFWEIVVEKSALRENEEQPFTMWNDNYYLEKYKTKETYAEDRASVIPYALVVNGEWHEKGKMGWWAVSDATYESS
jgi:hypothetical protein